MKETDLRVIKTKKALSSSLLQLLGTAIIPNDYCQSNLRQRTRTPHNIL